MYQKSKFYIPAFTYRPSKDELSTVQSFAEMVAPTTLEHYRKRGQPDLTLEQNIQGHKNAGLSEIAYYEYLKSKGLEMTKPDFTLHVIKSFGADLKAKHPLAPDRELKIHVKTQDISKVEYTNRTPSFSFHPTDKLVTNPTENDLIGMSVVNGDCVDIVAILPANLIFPRFKDVQRNGNKSKVAIYYRAIKNAIIEKTFFPN
jgi:hypothetical protein